MSKRKNTQLVLEVRLYRVRGENFEIDIQASSAGAAKYQAFRKAREAGYHADPRNAFREFLNRGIVAVELRR